MAAMVPRSCLHSASCAHALHCPRPQRCRRQALVVTPRAALSELLEASQSVLAAQSPDLSWQIAAGALAGVTPFVVAGVEFSKRISAQRRCSTCGGSGLVKKDEYYFRCSSCGGFLPWYSWRRFFKG